MNHSHILFASTVPIFFPTICDSWPRPTAEYRVCVYSNSISTSPVQIHLSIIFLGEHQYCLGAGGGTLARGSPSFRLQLTQISYFVSGHPDPCYASSLVPHCPLHIRKTSPAPEVALLWWPAMGHWWVVCSPGPLLSCCSWPFKISSHAWTPLDCIFILGS